MAQTPQIETVRRAETTTPTAQQVTILITAIDSETDTGWYVYGYRTGSSTTARRRHGLGGTSRPNLYFIAR